MKFRIELRTGRGLNERLHWAQRAKKVKHERHTTAWWIKVAKVQRPELPVTVTLTRLTSSALGLDDDNLRGSLKAVRDELASWLGVDDRDPRVTWRYEQKLRAGFGVEVSIDSSSSPCQSAGPSEV